MKVRLTMDIDMKQHKGVHGFICAYEDIKQISEYLDSILKEYFDHPKSFDASYGRDMQIINGYLHRAVLELEGVDTFAPRHDHQEGKNGRKQLGGSGDEDEDEDEDEEIVCGDNWHSAILRHKREMGITAQEWKEFLRQEIEYSKIREEEQALLKC